MDKLNDNTILTEKEQDAIKDILDFFAEEDTIVSFNIPNLDKEFKFNDNFEDIHKDTFSELLMDNNVESNTITNNTINDRCEPLVYEKLLLPYPTMHLFRKKYCTIPYYKYSNKYSNTFPKKLMVILKRKKTQELSDKPSNDILFEEKDHYIYPVKGLKPKGFYPTIYI
jgi:hypothetical protein